MQAATPMKWLAIAAFAATVLERCAGAGLSGAADPGDRAVRGRQRQRRRHAHHARPHGQDARPAVHRRQPSGCRRQHRHAGGGANGAGWLYAGDQHGRPAWRRTRTLFKSLGYDPEKDFTPISLFAILPNVVVINSKLPPKTLTEFVAYAKQRPKELNYGSVGVGCSQHLGRRLFRTDRRRATGARAVSQHRAIHARLHRRTGAARLPVPAQRRRHAELGRRARARSHEPEAHDGAARCADREGSRPRLRDLRLARIARARRNAEAGRRQAPQGDRGSGERRNRAQPVCRARRRTCVARAGELQKFIAAETAKWKATIEKAGIEPM